MTEQKKYQPPYYGAAYYPEDWPMEQVDEDIRLMKDAGMNVMRVAEFAWARMEPAYEMYDFDWLHEVIDKLDAAGIATIMCTPTATPPAWLTEQHPEVLFVNPDGRRVGHGGRRHTCPNNPVYRQHSARITHRMAVEFGRDERIIGWQIDNEVAPHYDFESHRSFFMRTCCCPVCHANFIQFMKARYGTIDVLNDAWCTHLWSQRYDDFDQLPLPDRVVWHHPSLLTAWEEFTSKSYIDYVNEQAEILHTKTIHPIGTDMMPFPEIDHYEMNESLDIVQYNHYDFREGFRNAAFWMDHMRPIKEQPFWNTETATCWAGNVVTSGYSEPGFCRANSWLPIALGGEANLFWLWRTHWAGQELMHGSVVSSQGRPMHIFGEVQEVSRGYKAAASFLNNTKPVNSGLALHFNHISHLILKNQSLKPEFNYTGELMQHWYHPLIRRQYRPDVIGAQTDLAQYKLLLSPMLPTLEAYDLKSRLQQWIEEGGIWLAGPLTDIRNADCAKYRHAPFGVLEDWLGVYSPYQLPGYPRSFKQRWVDGTLSEGSVTHDAFELRGGEALAWYTENELDGLAAVVTRSMGKGKIVLLGTQPEESALFALIGQLANEAGVNTVASGDNNVLCVPRSGPAGKGAVLVELDGKPGVCRLPYQGRNLLTGETTEHLISLPAYGVAVIQYDAN